MQGSEEMKHKLTPLGLRIIEKLNEKGLTQTDFCKSINLDSATLSHVMRGHCAKYSDTTVLRISSALGISLAD